MKEIPLVKYPCAQDSHDYLEVEENFDGLGAMMFEVTAHSGKLKYPVWLSVDDAQQLALHLARAVTKVVSKTSPIVMGGNNGEGSQPAIEGTDQ